MSVLCAFCAAGCIAGEATPPTKPISSAPASFRDVPVKVVQRGMFRLAVPTGFQTAGAILDWSRENLQGSRAYVEDFRGGQGWVVVCFCSTSGVDAWSALVFTRQAVSRGENLEPSWDFVDLNAMLTVPQSSSFAGAFVQKGKLVMFDSKFKAVRKFDLPGATPPPR